MFSFRASFKPDIRNLYQENSLIAAKAKGGGSRSGHWQLQGSVPEVPLELEHGCDRSSEAEHSVDRDTR